MKAAETIRIANVYYMLAYAFEALRKGPYEKISPDEFTNAEDMFGWILGLGMTRLVKQGLYREYIDVSEDIAGLRGKIEMRGTIAHRIAKRPMLRVEHDEFSEDNLFNQILKTTATMLFRSNRLEVSKSVVKNVLPYFQNVSSVSPSEIRWNQLRYQRNNQQYVMLMNVCRFVIDEMMMAKKHGDTRVLSLDIPDEKLHALFEAFVRAYFARHFDLPTRTRRIQWDIDEDVDRSYLPEMQADIVLEKSNRTLIVDTKFYGAILGGRVGGKVSNDHLYQILAYVNNYAAHHSGVNVSGMLLYAKTSIDDFESATWTIGDHRIDVRTLNLDQEFSKISATLDATVRENFGDIERRGCVYQEARALEVPVSFQA